MGKKCNMCISVTKMTTVLGRVSSVAVLLGMILQLTSTPLKGAAATSPGEKSSV